MGKTTKISWADSTFIPWHGCQAVGPGCDNCYVQAWAKRCGRLHHWGPDGERKRTSNAYWREPLKWNEEARASGKPWTVFASSDSDIFDKRAKSIWRADFWRLTQQTPYLTWLVLTKRAGNMKPMLPKDWGRGYRNVWLMITVVNQAEADRDIPKLLDVPARWYGLSTEPLLGEIDLYPWLFPDPLIHWVITGGESGARRRAPQLDWFRLLRDQCYAAKVPFHFKQHSGLTPTSEGRLLDGREWTELPDWRA